MLPPRNGCDGRLMAKFLIMTIHLCCLQEMAVMAGYGKNFNNDNSGESVLPPPSFTRIQYQIHLNFHY